MKSLLRNRSHKKIAQDITNNNLVSDYTSALINRSTAHVARTEALHSEKVTEDLLKSTHPSNSFFVTPQDIPKDIQDSLAKASLDAHMKKVQAKQISSKTIAQIQSMEYANNQKYRNKKILITILEPSLHPVHSYWQNSKTGNVTTGKITAKTLKGIVQEIDFNKNLLLLKPTRLSRTINPDRKLFAVYVINPETFQPMVSISLV